jgi:hypothetical protein
MRRERLQDMSTFFEPPPPPREEPAYVPSPWHGPPEDVLGAPAGGPFLVARTNALALAVWGLAAFPTGLAFSLAMVSRAGDDAGIDPDFDVDMAFHRYWRRLRRDGEQELPDEMLRFGVEFDDGRKATNVRTGWELEEGEEPLGPVLTQRGGGGGGRSYRQGWWLWPLPPGERLAFVVEWPAKGISLTRQEIDAGEIRRATEQARPIWD